MQPFFEYLKNTFTWFGSFLSEETNGKGSMKRLIMFLSTCAFLLSYVKTTLFNNKIEDIPITWAMLLAGFVGLNIYSNVVQNKKIEDAK
ncbi:MAG: hypothetical protein WC139_06995 [Candidatus Kapaibacterium sp.]